jgi:hypothetical protein
MLVSSLLVTATSMSASSAPAWRSTVGKRPRPYHGADVQAVAQIAQAIGVGVDHGDVVGFAGQMFGQRAAHLPCAENDDLHRDRS